MIGKSPLDASIPGQDYAFQMTKLAEEIRRLGSIRGGAGIEIKSCAGGIIVHSIITPPSFYFGQLQSNLTKNGNVIVKQYITPGAWTLSDDTHDVYGSPLLGDDTLETETDIQYSWSAAYDQYIIENAACPPEDSTSGS